MIKMADNLYFTYENDMDSYFPPHLIEETIYCNVSFFSVLVVCVTWSRARSSRSVSVSSKDRAAKEK